MAANIATINGELAMAYQGATPWHQLGTRVAGTTDVAQAMTAAQQNWLVSKETLQLADGTVAHDVRAIVRDVDRRIIGVVGRGFEPIQNHEAFGILTDACRDHGVTIESAGCLGNGARTWMLAKLPDSSNIEPLPGDTVKGYFLIVNAHDGSYTYQSLCTPVRVVCQNTLSEALYGEKSTVVRIRHTKSAPERVDEAKRLVTRMFDAMQHTGAAFRTLAAKRWSPAQIAQWIEEVLPADLPKGLVSPTLKQRRQDIGMLVWAGKGADLAGADGTGSTAWGAYNALTEYFDHVRPAQTKSDGALAKANESAIFGSGAAMKALALQKALQLVRAA